MGINLNNENGEITIKFSQIKQDAQTREQK